MLWTGVPQPAGAGDVLKATCPVVHVMNGIESHNQEKLEVYNMCIKGDGPNDPCYEREYRSQEEMF
jgi:hypothetical protein